MMNNNYVIHWKNSNNGRAGRGSKLFLKKDAEQLARELNHEYPQIHHEAAEFTPAADNPEPVQTLSA